MVEFLIMKKHKIFKCPICIAKKVKKDGSLFYKDKGLICCSCNSYYPLYKNLPVLLTFKNDFYHLKKALSHAKYRVNKFEN